MRKTSCKNRVKTNDSIRSFSQELTALLGPSQAYAQESTLSSDSGFSGFAVRLFRLQFQYNPIYRQWCETRGVEPDRIHHWSEIPAMPAVGFREKPVTCIEESERLHCFQSSGTTHRNTSRHFHHHESLGLYESSLLPPFLRHLLPAPESVSHQPKPGGPSCQPFLIILTPSKIQAPSSSLVHMMDTIHRHIGKANACFTGLVDSSGGWDLDLNATVKVLNQTENTNRRFLVLGTAFAFVHLLDHLSATGRTFRLPEGSRVLETGGYKGKSRQVPKSDLHESITRLLGVPPRNIVSEYGMCELSSQAYDHIAGARFQESRNSLETSRSFYFPPWARFRIISPETGLEPQEGEIGLIQVFDLANAWSVLAIQTEDLGIQTGQGFKLVGRAIRAEQRGCSLMQKEASHEPSA